MLSCKEFVEQCSANDERIELTPSQRLQVYLHKIICHHCRKYAKQFNVTTSVARQIKPKHASEQIIENSMTSFKKHTDN